MLLNGGELDGVRLLSPKTVLDVADLPSIPTARLELRPFRPLDAPRVAELAGAREIADTIGSSRETVSRTMRNLVERGIIQVSRKDITLKDRRSLMLAARRA